MSSCNVRNLIKFNPYKRKASNMEIKIILWIIVAILLINFIIQVSFYLINSYTKNNHLLKIKKQIIDCMSNENNKCSCFKEVENEICKDCGSEKNMNISIEKNGEIRKLTDCFECRMEDFNKEFKKSIKH